MISFDATGYFVNLLILSMVVAPAYRLSPSPAARQGLMFLLGAVLIYFVAPRLVLLYFLYWIVVSGVQRFVLSTRDGQWATSAMWAGVGVLLSPMLVWKFGGTMTLAGVAVGANMLLTEVMPQIGFVDAHRDLLVPIGLSFATFRAVDLVLQTYLGSVDRVPLARVLAYGFCPVLIPVGPIATIQEVDYGRNATAEDVKYSMLRIASGLVKVYLIASMISDWGGLFRSYDRPGWQILASLAVYTFYFYLNFAGYSDMAIGAGRLFGIRLPENFRWPVFRGSPQQFWANWHATLSRFAQRYVFTALGGYRTNRQLLAMYGSMMVIVWWHEPSLSWTLFGLYHGSGLAVHRWWTRHRPAIVDSVSNSLWYRIVCSLAFFVFLAMSFPIISVPLQDLPAFYLAMLR